MTPRPLCVFLNSGDQGGLPSNHPFYRLVEETIQNVVQCPLVMLYMARNTLNHNPFSDAVPKKQRVMDIAQYLQNVCPTISGSNSPTMESTFVEMRAYSSCASGEGRMKRKAAPKHVYIQQRLADAWMQAYSTDLSYAKWEGKFLQVTSPSTIYGCSLMTLDLCSLLTFFVKLCLLRGLIAAVNLQFRTSIKGMDHIRNPEVPPSTHTSSSCSFEHFLSEWSNAWLVFDKTPSSSTKLPYNKLSSIVFTNRTSGFRHVEIKGDALEWQYDWQCYDNDLVKKRAVALQLLASGNWTAFPEASPFPYNVFHSCCRQMWNSPPMEVSKPRDIEKTMKL